MSEPTQSVSNAPAPIQQSVTNAVPAVPKSVPTTGAGIKPVSLTAAVNKAQGALIKPPSSLKLFNTNELGDGYFHGCVYGDTSVRKSSTAAAFGGPQNTRIILTRRREQLIPLKDEGYEVALVEDAEALNFAMMYPETLWPDWAKGENPDRTLVLDDATEAVAMLLEDASTIDGKEVKDRRRSYTKAGEDLRETVRSVLRKPMNFVMVALAKVKENNLTNDEQIRPDLPPSMTAMLMTELEFVFYIKPSNWKFVTDRDFFSYTDTDPNTQKERTYRREIFAKHKLPKNLLGKQPPIVAKEEVMDLGAIWKRVRSASKVAK